MITGHFSLATGTKAVAPRLPLWALLLASFWLDVIFIFLFAAAIEGLTQVDPAHPAYGGALIHAYYTHSLVGALAIAALTGWLVTRWWGRQGGLVIGAVVFSHWVLDLLVHRPDLPILPGNLGNLPLLGLGLWNYPWLSAAVELAMVLIGVYLYYQRASQLPTAPGDTAQQQRRRVLTATLTTFALLVLLLAVDLLAL